MQLQAIKTAILFGLLIVSGCAGTWQETGGLQGAALRRAPHRVALLSGTPQVPDPQGSCPQAAEGQPTVSSCTTDPTPEATPPAPKVFDVRVGAQTGAGSVMLVACLETLFLGPLSVELCGDGRGLILDKNAPEPTLTWYRARWRALQMHRGRLRIAPIVQAGMAELRVGQLEAGYLPGRGSPRQLALGPELGAALELVWPLGAGVKLVGDIHVDAAWIPRAGELLLSQDRLQPSVGVTAGIGF